jgi:DNA-binding transcriptional regulator YhcF (GntR family)
MKKLFEVYFTLAEPASVVIEARDEDEAEEIFEQMTRKELLERIANALEMGVEITEIEDLNEEDE